MRNLDKFCGCLIGGAAGDALGYAVEFLRESQIFSIYGKEGITEYTLRNGIAEISDDTQMTLFTAEGLLLAKDSSDYTDSIRQMYKCWYKTQVGRYPLTDTEPHSRLLDIPDLFSMRAPGMTCLSAIADGANGTVSNPVNNSKGCGGVMRVAPIGLYFADTSVPFEVSDMLGAEAAALTHGHDLGYIPAAALVHIIRLVTESDVPLKSAVNDSVKAMEKLFPKAAHISEFTAIMQKAVQLAETDIDDFTAVHQLGEGWVAEETLAIAAYCAMRYKNDFDMALQTAVNHNGDSDSTGAVCGNILGAYLGYNAVSEKYKTGLELQNLIIKIAGDLYNAKI